MVAAAVTPKSARFGWKDRPADVLEALERMPRPTFAAAADRETLATEHRDVFFWEQGEIPLFGETLPAHRQTVGDCVSQAWARAVQDLIYMGAARAGYDSPELREQIATEPTYGFSRVEVGKGRIRGDGSTGAWAARAVTEFGVLRRRVYGRFDFSKYSGQVARTFGRYGVPDELEPIARDRVVDTTSLVVEESETKAALYNLYPIPVCSNQGFTERRDKYGFCDPRGSWAHCMLVRGIALVKRAGKLILAVPIQQSWGESPTGPNEVELGDGRRVKLPQGVFMVEFDVLLRMLRGWRDSFALTGAKLFLPQRPIFAV